MGLTRRFLQTRSRWDFIFAKVSEPHTRLRQWDSHTRNRKQERKEQSRPPGAIGRGTVEEEYGDPLKAAK